MNGKKTKGTPVAPSTATTEPRTIDKASTLTWFRLIVYAFALIFIVAFALMWINFFIGGIRISAF